MKITRRSMAGLMAALAAGRAAPVRAQAPPQPAAPPKPTADQDLSAARQDVQLAARQVAQVPLPRSTEPAFRFRA